MFTKNALPKTAGVLLALFAIGIAAQARADGGRYLAPPPGYYGNGSYYNAPPAYGYNGGDPVAGAVANIIPYMLNTYVAPPYYRGGYPDAGAYRNYPPGYYYGRGHRHRHHHEEYEDEDDD